MQCVRCGSELGDRPYCGVCGAARPETLVPPAPRRTRKRPEGPPVGDLFADLPLAPESDPPWARAEAKSWAAPRAPAPVDAPPARVATAEPGTEQPSALPAPVDAPPARVATAEPGTEQPSALRAPVDAPPARVATAEPAAERPSPAPAAQPTEAAPPPPVAAPDASAVRSARPRPSATPAELAPAARPAPPRPVVAPAARVARPVVEQAPALPVAQPGASTARREAAPVIHVRMAGFWRRGLALLLDGAIIAGVVWLVLRIGVGSLDLSRLPSSPLWGVDYLVYLLLEHPGKLGPMVLFALVVTFAYLFLFQAIFATTPGKRALGLRIVDGCGRRIGPVRAFFRTLAYGISVGFFMMGFLWAAFDLERRSLHDVLCGTYVIVGTPTEASSPPVASRLTPGEGRV